MRIRLLNWHGGHCVVSFAKDSETAERLKSAGHSFWFLEQTHVVTWPENREYQFSVNEMEQLRLLNNFDVIEVFEHGLVIRLYDDSSSENLIFVTGRCNSNCIMCPSPTISREKGVHTPIETLISLAKRIPSDAGHITITGGEPFLIGESIFEVLSYLKNNAEENEYLILTNGRALAIPRYLEALVKNVPANTMLGIPLHASNAALHDQITQSPGSYLQTTSGLDQLLALGMTVEIRIVVSKRNLHDLSNLAALISKRFAAVSHVSIIGMEMTGSAFEHQDSVWVSYKDSFPDVKQAVNVLLQSGIDVMLYNFPLCTIEPNYWPLCKKSISPEKIRYGNECVNCRVKHICGGVFSGTIRLEKKELVPIS